MAEFFGAINVDCPNCGKELPQIGIVSRRAQVKANTAEVVLDADLSPEWWAQVRKDHPDCVLA